MSENDPFDLYRTALATINGLIVAEPPYGKTLPEIRARAEHRLGRLRAFLDYLGRPQDGYPIVHVTGTSGKGSTSTAAAAILTAAGYRTGLHTSPYLQVATEKAAIDGRLIDGAAFDALVDELVDASRQWRGEQLTYAELWVALVLVYFARERVDAAVIEVGAGGRFDLTNIVQPAVSVITSIGIDHTETLGGTIEEIAWHKAGIIKAGRPAVSAVTEPVPASIIAAEAEATGSRLKVVDRAVPVDAAPDVEGRLRWRHGETVVTAAMPGGYQAVNGETAIAALEQCGFEISEQAIVAGIAAARLPGRLELVQGGPRVYLDGAHNPQKIAALAGELPRLAEGRLIVVLGALEAKDQSAIVAEIAAHADLLVLTRPSVFAKPGADPAKLAGFARAAGFTGPVTEIDAPLAAIEQALIIADERDTVLVTGSLYLVGNIREQWFPSAEIVRQRTPWPETLD
jgi:dihydrofolate synthase/folylpolyglutamate synthase